MTAVRATLWATTRAPWGPLHVAVHQASLRDLRTPRPAVQALPRTHGEGRECVIDGSRPVGWDLATRPQSAYCPAIEQVSSRRIRWTRSGSFFRRTHSSTIPTSKSPDAEAARGQRGGPGRATAGRDRRPGDGRRGPRPTHHGAAELRWSTDAGSRRRADRGRCRRSPEALIGISDPMNAACTDASGVSMSGEFTAPPPAPVAPRSRDRRRSLLGDRWRCRRSRSPRHGGLEPLEKRPRA